MLRRLNHLTINLELRTLTPPRHDSDPIFTYAFHARKAISTVCLGLVSASKMEGLTIEVTFEDFQASDADLADIMWSLIFYGRTLL